MSIKILLGGSPCTYWSVAQNTGKRETTAEGLGWELFRNYLIAKEKFHPDYFLYENNQTASPEIKEQISETLGVELTHINSSLVSAQSRKRFYAFNWEISRPEERNIFVKDILEDKGVAHECTNFFKPLRVGTIGKGGQGERIYSISGKSVTLMANGGGWGAKTGLYAIPVDKPIANSHEIMDGEGVIMGRPCKSILPIECERLQTMPDNYTAGVSNTQRYKGLGNGWTAEVIIHILNGILKDVPKDEELVVLSMYDGIGTGRYCLDKMGFTNVTYHAYEIDKYAMEISHKNYPDIIQHGDAFALRNDDWDLEVS